jgi:predicted dehydrogenase
MSLNQNVLLIGAGPMAVDYAKVLTALDRKVVAVGRRAASGQAFKEKTGIDVVTGGLNEYLRSGAECPAVAIVAVGVEALAEAACTLISHGVRQILLEKPGALTREEILRIQALAKAKNAEVLIAYNRRFFASTLRAQELIAEYGGVQSMHFEFTEWSHVISGISKAPGVKSAWLLANSTHVIDLAFYLGGTPTDWRAYTGGALDWHPTAASFAGAGRTDRGVLFSYQANWGAPGRWGVEVLTADARLIFRPMESLQIMRKGSIAVESVSLDDTVDKLYKPGLYEQVRRFLSGERQGFCTVEEQADTWDIYSAIAGY